MPDSNTPALVLDDQSSSSTEAAHFSGFPGVWFPDRPIAVTELGFSDLDEALARVEELGLPLSETTVAAGEGAMPARDNHMPGLEEVRGTDWKPLPGQPGMELGPGEVFPPATVTVEESAEAMEPALEPNAAEVIAAVGLVDDVATLDALELSEQQHKNRSTVLKAIDERRTEVAPAEVNE